MTLAANMFFSARVYIYFLNLLIWFFDNVCKVVNKTMCATESSLVNC